MVLIPIHEASAVIPFYGGYRGSGILRCQQPGQGFQWNDRQRARKQASLKGGEHQLGFDREREGLRQVHLPRARYE